MAVKVRRRSVRVAAVALAVLGLIVPGGAEGGAIYGYDPAGRLTTVLYENGLCALYVYDASGNRLLQISSGAVANPATWGTAVWGTATWVRTPLRAIWGTGLWGCYQWTP